MLNTKRKVPFFGTFFLCSYILNRDGTNNFGNAEDIVNEDNMKKSFSVQVFIDNFSYMGKEYKSVTPLYLV